MKLSELFRYQKKTKEKPPRTEQLPLERIFNGKTPNEAALAAASREREEKREAEKKRILDECLERLGYTGRNLEEMKADGYRRNMKNGVYVRDTAAPLGSIDNPREVGMEGCCTSLFFVAELGGWVLTDGLGNGVLR